MRRHALHRKSPSTAPRAAWLPLLVLLMTAAAWGRQPAAEPPPVPAVQARREANFAQLNGVPTVLMWAIGCENPQDLDQYAALGFNTLYMMITSAFEEELSQASALASAAEKRGLMVVAALAPTAVQDAEGTELAIDPSSQAYAEVAQEFARRVAEALQDHPRLIAWSLEAVPPDQVVWNDAGFRSYLQDWYPSLAALNASWGTEFSNWGQITTAGVRDIDTTKPGGLGRASVDFAYYREASYADLLSVWARALRAADPARLLFASALSDYRSIISVRTDFDGLILNTYPSVAEADWQTHNVHAVDIARRGNLFAAVQTLEVGARTDPAQVVAWASLALAHGAAGVAFSNWPAVRDSDRLRAAVGEILRTIQADRAFPAQPAPRAAILYEPITGGALRNDQGLYGYLDGFTPDEPSRLFAACRNGSRFGQFDILTLDSIKDVDLHRYRVILAPAALYLPDDAQITLHNFVMAGGALAVDSGVGMYQAEGVLDSVPSIMREVLGIHFDLPTAPTQPEPTLETGQPAGYGPPLPETPGVQANPDLRRFAGILEEFLRRPEVVDYLGPDFLDEQALGVRVHALGQGFAVYVPTFLYQAWAPSDPLFAEFHSRLLSYGGDLEVVEPRGLWPGVAAAVYQDWSIGLASPNRLPTSVVLYGASNQLYQVPAGAMRLGNPNQEDRAELLFPGAPLAVAHALPIYVTPLEPRSVVTVSVIAYRPDRIELLVYGTGAQVAVRQGSVQAFGGLASAMEITISDGLYPLAPGSTHRVTVKQGPAGQLRWQRELMPNPDTGMLVIQDTFFSARVIVEPVSD